MSGDQEITFRRHERERGFTVVDNVFIDDERLSYKETGLLVYLLRKPTNWRVRRTQLAKAKTDGRDSVDSALTGLARAGYLHRELTRDDRGRVTGVVYDYAGWPKWDGCDGTPDAPFPAFPETAEPETGNPSLLSTEGDQSLRGTSSPSESAPARRRASRRRVGTMLTPEQIENWSPAPEQRAALRAVAAPGVDIDVELANFRDWHLKNGRSFVDPMAAARQWVRRARPDRLPAQSRVGGTVGGSAVENLRRFKEQREAAAAAASRPAVPASLFPDDEIVDAEILEDYR